MVQAKALKSPRADRLFLLCVFPFSPSAIRFQAVNPKTGRARLWLHDAKSLAGKLFRPRFWPMIERLSKRS